MSHFNVLVLTQSGVEEQAEELLAPFDEGREVEEYSRECWCRGHKAKLRIHNKLTEETPIDRARLEFSKRPDVQKMIERSKNAGNYGFSKEADSLWEEVFVKPFESRMAAMLEAEPDKNDPDPDCNDCGGTGHETTTYNPQSKWDEYEHDSEWVSLFRSVQGVSAAEFLEFAAKQPGPYLTLAILTPEGKWLQKGEVLNNGFIKDALSDEEWQAIFTETLQKFSDSRVLIYDCHI